jgi:hypothetical protein
MTAGTCDGCGKVRRLNDDGRIPRHYIKLSVSRRVIPVVGGKATVTRLCSGSGKVPRRPLGEAEP